MKRKSCANRIAKRKARENSIARSARKSIIRIFPQREEVNGENIRTYVCTNCGAITTQNMGEQYEQVSSYIGYLFGQYQPYMWWVLLATAGVWSIVMGVFFAIAQKNEDKEKARKMIRNYVIGLVVIFAILVACPYLVKGIAALIAG